MNIDSNRTAKQSSKEKLTTWLTPLILFTTFLGLIVGVVESVTKFLSVFEEKFYLTLTVLWIASLLLTFRIRWSELLGSRFSERILRIAVVSGISLTFLFSVGWRFYELRIKQTSPAKPTTFKLSLGAASLSKEAFAQESPKSALHIESFYLNKDLCSYQEQPELFPDGNYYRSFSPNSSVLTALMRGICVGPSENKPIREVYPLIKKRLEKMGRKDLLEYVDSPEHFAKLAERRGDIFEQVIYTNAELKTMKAEAPHEFEIVKEWLLNCVGVFQPVLTLTVNNTSAEPVILNKVIYDVIDISRVRGGATGPIYPEITYDHYLKYRKGEQPFYLNPPLRINGGDTTAFNLRLFSADKGVGLSWFLKIRLVDSSNRSVETEPFEIFMSKD